MIHIGLIGFPVEHSLSRKIHSAAIRSSGLDGDYSLFSIRPGDMRGLKEMLNRVRSGEMTGLNVTIPHKQNVIPLLDGAFAGGTSDRCSKYDLCGGGKAHRA